MVLRVGPNEAAVRQASAAGAARARAALLARAAAQAARPAAQAAARPADDDTTGPSEGERANAWLGQARRTAGMGPSEAQLWRLAHDVELPLVLLPPPSTAVNVARLDRVRERIDFARAGHAAPGPRDLGSMRRRLGLSPRVERALGALLGRSTEPPAPGAAAPSGAPTGRLEKALGFTLRRRAAPAVAAVAAKPAQAAPNAQATRTLPPSMSWSAFAALLTQRQLRALLDLALLRLRDVALQNESELWARLAEHERNRQEITSERLTQLVDFINVSAFARASWASGKASPLRNARPYGRGQGAIEPLDGREASAARAELRRAEAALTRRRGLAAAPGRLTAPGQVLDWVPADGTSPAQALRRVALTTAELADLGDDERATHDAATQRLRLLERHDASSTFARLVLSAAQLEQAAERCRRAAAQETGPAAANLADLAERYRAAAQEHAERAKSCGYFEAVAAVGRRQRLELAQGVAAEAELLGPAARRLRALEAEANDLQLPAGERAEARAQAAELEVEVEDRRLRLAGMHAAATLSGDVRPPGEGPLREIVRTLWRGQRPLDPDRAGYARAFAPLREAIVPQGTQLLGGGRAADHLEARAEAAAGWAAGYQDAGFSRLQAINRVASAAPRSIAPTAQVVSRQAQAALDDVASYFEGDRNAFYQALGQEQGATQALVERLRGLQRVGG